MTQLLIPRRKFLIGAAATLLAAPAIVRASSLMKVKPVDWGVDIDPLSYLGRREDILGIIYNVNPTDTPFLSMLVKGFFIDGMVE